MFKKTFLALFSLAFFQCYKNDPDEENTKPLNQKGVVKKQEKKDHSMINIPNNIFNGVLVQIESQLTSWNNEYLRRKSTEIKEDIFLLAKFQTCKTLISVVVENSINKHQMQNRLYPIQKFLFPEFLFDTSQQTVNRSNELEAPYKSKDLQLWQKFREEQNMEVVGRILAELEKSYLEFIEPKKVEKFNNEWLQVCSQMKDFVVLAESKLSERLKLIV